jgi:hypothetical protein
MLLAAVFLFAVALKGPVFTAPVSTKFVPPSTYQYRIIEFPPETVALAGAFFALCGLLLVVKWRSA